MQRLVANHSIVPDIRNGEKTMTGRILFIDDDKAGREVAFFNLRRAGYEITPAEDGE